MPVLIALVTFNAEHPGRIMAGKKVKFPSRKERMALFKNGGSGMNGSELLPTISPYEPVGEGHLTGIA